MRIRLVLVILFLMLPISSASIGRWVGASREPTSIDRVPAQLGGIPLVREAALSDRVLSVIEPEDYLMALYGATAEQIWTYVAFYSGYGVTGAHDPSVCYPSQGWVISDLNNYPLTLTSGETLNAKLFRAHQGPQVELVLYWFQPSRRWPRTEPVEPFLRVFDAITGAKQYAFVRLSLPLLDTSEATERRATDQLMAMARDLAPWTRGILSGETEVLSASWTSSTGSGVGADQAQTPH